MEKRWLLKPSPDPIITNNLATALGSDKFLLLAKLLVQRGYETYNEAKAFFNPDLRQIHDPFLMADMDKAVDRLNQALESNEKILVFGDYDVDGTTSVALVFHFLSRIYKNLDYYVPDRYKEGYGISDASIAFAHQAGISLIISLDCGIKSVEKIANAKTLGIDYIVCDHHLPGETLPPAVAVLDAKRADCNYPYKELAGCGVGFKLMQALCIRNKLDINILYSYFDLVAISVAADIVPITGENRVFVHKGLELINLNPRPGVEALLQAAGFMPQPVTKASFPSSEALLNPDRKRSLNVTNVVFGLAPRINAAGRMEHAKAAVALLLEEDTQKAEEFAYGINQNNSARKEADSQITEMALAIIKEFYPETRSTVLFHPDWGLGSGSKGVIGIVASRCIESYYRPTIILTESNGKAVGSARSVAGFDLYEAISQCSDLLEQYGGHTHAAGLTLKKENIDAFRQRFEEIAKASLTTHEQTVPGIDIDLEIQLSDLSESLGRSLKRMGPFGPGNMSPVFMCRNVFDIGRGYRLRAKTEGVKDHLKLWLCQDGCNIVWEAIGFGMGDWIDPIGKGKKVDICFSLDSNTFNNRETWQLMLKDVRLGEGGLE